MEHIPIPHTTHNVPIYIYVCRKTKLIQNPSFSHNLELFVTK